MAVAHALGHDEVAGDGQIFQRYAAGADDGCAVHILGVSARLVEVAGEHVVQHDGDFSAGDVGRGHDSAAAAVDVALGGHGLHGVQGPGGDLILIGEAGGGPGLAGELHDAGEHHHGLLAGDGGGGTGVGAVALEDAGGAGLEDGVGVPGAILDVGKGVAAFDLIAHDAVQNDRQLGAGDVGGGVQVSAGVSLEDAPIRPGTHGPVIPIPAVGLSGRGGDQHERAEHREGQDNGQ